MAVDTTEPEYWLNWGFLLCAIWVYSCMALACFLIWKYEGPNSQDADDDGGDREEARPWIGPGIVYLEDCWKPCLEQIHPGWLLAFHLVSFFMLALLLAFDVVVDGWSIFLYYTHLARCFQFTDAISMLTRLVGIDLMQIMPLISLLQQGKAHMSYDHPIKSPCCSKAHGGQEIAGFWGYMFQIMFQTNAGAVMITDLVFWFILYPFLAHDEYDMNFVALPISRLNIPSSTCMVFGDSIAALPLLCFIRPSSEAQIISVGKLVSS